MPSPLRVSALPHISTGDAANTAILKRLWADVGTDADGYISKYLTPADIINGADAAVAAKVAAGITTWVGAAPGALDTLVEIASRLSADQTALDALLISVGLKATIANPFRV